MRHKWEKLVEEAPILDIEDEEIIFKHQAINCMKCIHCNLKKGTVRTLSYFPKLVFFEEDVILSIDKIPYKCETIKKQRQTMLFTEQEFEIV